MASEKSPSPKDISANKMNIQASNHLDEIPRKGMGEEVEYRVSADPEDIGQFIVVDSESSRYEQQLADVNNQVKIEHTPSEIQDSILVNEEANSSESIISGDEELSDTLHEDMDKVVSSNDESDDYGAGQSAKKEKKNKKTPSKQRVTDEIGRRNGTTDRGYKPKNQPLTDDPSVLVEDLIPDAQTSDRPDGVDKVNRLFNEVLGDEGDEGSSSSAIAGLGIESDFIPRDGETFAPKGPYTQEQLAREERMLAFRKSSEYTDARDAYKEQDDSLAVSVARRMKVGAFARRKTREALQDTVDTSLESYEKVAEVFDDIQIKKWKNADPGISEADIAKKLAVYHEAKQRLHGIHQRQEIHTTEKSSKYGFINKAQEWNEKIQQKYAGLSRKQKLGVAAAGIAVGGVAGFALGGFGVLGGVLLVAAKGYQTYAKSHSELYNVDKVSPAQLSRKGNEKARSQNSMQKETQDSIRSAVTSRIEKADTINKRAKWMTIGSVALLGLGAAEKFGAFKEIGDWVREAGVPDLNTTPGNTVEDVPTADPVETNTPESDPLLDTDRPEGADDGTGRGSTGEAGTEGGDSYSWSGDALNVSSGEGWYQTFAEMGISDFADQQALLNDSELMNKLYDQGLAYPDASAGGWGMNLTFDGKMPQESLDLIADHAVEKGLVSRSVFDLAA